MKPKAKFLPKDKVKTQVQFIDEHNIMCPVYFWMRQFIFGMGLQQNFKCNRDTYMYTFFDLSLIKIQFEFQIEHARRDPTGDRTFSLMHFFCPCLLNEHSRMLYHGRRFILKPNDHFVYILNGNPEN